MALGAHPEASLRQRTGEAFEQKHAIARWAASVIRPWENILLDAGSRCRGLLAYELRGFEKLSVTTPGSNTGRLRGHRGGLLGRPAESLSQRNSL
jgi:DeoR/GlpR family transcriptional regulator of sugar metabolism